MYAHCQSEFWSHIIFDGTYNKAHPSTNRNRCHGQPLPPSIILLNTCALTTSLREAVGPLPILLGGPCTLLRAGARRQCLRCLLLFKSCRHCEEVQEEEGQEEKEEGGKVKWRGCQENIVWHLCCCGDDYQEICLRRQTPQAGPGHDVFTFTFPPIWRLFLWYLGA